MIMGRYCHSSVSLKNKLFVLGSFVGNESKTCEVFDSVCRTFVLLKNKPTSLTFRLNWFTKSFSIGNKLVILGSGSSTALFYNVDTDEFSEEPFEVTKDISAFSCSVVPKIEF